MSVKFNSSVHPYDLFSQLIYSFTHLHKSAEYRQTPVEYSSQN